MLRWQKKFAAYSEWYIPSSSKSGRRMESERIKKHKTMRTTTVDWPGGRDVRRSSSGGEPSFYWSSRRLLTGRHDNRLTQHRTSTTLRRRHFNTVYSIITNGIDGAVMLFTRTALHVWQRYPRALLSYPALTSLVSLAPCVSLSSPCGRHYANECPRSMAKLSTATSFVYLRVRSTVFAVHHREIRLS